MSFLRSSSDIVISDSGYFFEIASRAFKIFSSNSCGDFAVSISIVPRSKMICLAF